MNNERKQIETLSVMDSLKVWTEVQSITEEQKAILLSPVYKELYEEERDKNQHLESEIMRVCKVADDLHAENIQLKQVQNDLIEGR